MKSSPEQIRDLNDRFAGSSAEVRLRWAWETFGDRAAIGTSFQGAGIVIMDLARRTGLALPVFSLDTGLLFTETLELKKRLEDFFQISIEWLEPELSVTGQERVHGPELWKRDPDACCFMRKVEPLQKKLGNLDCWVTGLRRQQSAARGEIDLVEMYEFDAIANREIVKLNPLADWSQEAVWNHIREHKLPYNPLHDRGYRSIGCVPCTAKTGTGENERAGRWIGFNKTECGIHTFMKRVSTGSGGDQG